MTDKIVVLSTAASREEAQKIARALVERRLAACVTIVGPVESIYRWQSAIDHAQEFMLVIKTRHECFPPLLDAVRELNKYELPECIALRIEHGDENYLDWLAAETAVET